MEKPRESLPTMEVRPNPEIHGKLHPTIASRILGVLPLWVSDNLRSARSWKLLVRCWVASWTSLIVILPQSSLTALGNFAFFCILGSLMMPPSMPVQMFFFIISMLMLGILLGWALGAATMRAATSARDQVLLRSTYQAVQQTASTAANPDVAFRSEVFQGVFLDARSTVVYGVMFGVFSYLFALARAYRPQLMLLAIFGQIALDIFSTFGPLLPNVQYTIVSSFAISLSTYLAIGIVCCLLIFPETMSHSYLDSVASTLEQLEKYGALYGSLLKMSPEEIPDDPDGVVDQCIKQRMTLVLSVKDLEGKSALINAEFSFGRWNGSDAKSLEDPLRVVVARMVSFYSYPKLLSKTSVRSLSRSTTNSSGDREKHGLSSVPSAEDIAGDAELIRQLNSWRYDLETESNVRMADILPILLNATSDLRVACLEALSCSRNLIEHVNRGRWTRSSQQINERESELDKTLEQLRSSVKSFKMKGHDAIVVPFLPLLRAADEDHLLRKHLPLRPLIVASSFAAQLLVTADGIITLVDLIQRTTRKRQKTRLWAPSGLRALGNFLLRRRKDDGTLNVALGENAAIEIEEEEKEETAPFRRDPDSKPPSNSVQAVMDIIHSVYKWSKLPHSLFALKYVLVSVLLWLPAVLRHSAHFYYVEKGIWALTMAQMSINVYVSDTIYSIVTRLLGVFLGLVAGLVIWYIGNGVGNGNAYGLAAAYGVFIIPILFVRINAPPTLLLPLIMFNTTLALIIGYSWIDAKLNQVGNPGVGWPIAWKRFVLVMIGISAAAAVMMLPPVSGRKAVRLQSAALIDELSSVYSSLMSVWIEEEESDSGIGEEQEVRMRNEECDVKHEATSIPTKVKWAGPLRKRMLILVAQLQNMQVQAAMAKFEGNFRGAWPAEEYGKLLEQASNMLAALGQLSAALQRLDPGWTNSLNRGTAVLNPNFITDVMSTFAHVSQSLRTGEPMHQVLPTTLLERLLYHHTHDILSRAEREQLENVSYVERVSSTQFAFFSAGITAVSQIVESLDEMHRITARLCGEIPFKGFKKWKQDYHQAFRRD